MGYHYHCSEEEIKNWNAAKSPHPGNSDNIIPSSNTQAESESQNMAVSKSDVPQTEPTKKSASSENIESSTIESTKMTTTQNTEDANKPQMK